MSSPSYIKVRDIPSFLGVKRGEFLWIASDLTRLTLQAIRSEGGFRPDVLLDSFLDALGPDGTLVIPAFNFNLRSGDVFDLRTTVPVTGALAEAAMKRRDFRRTRHPLHSFLVAGKYSAELIRLGNRSSFGPDSPFAFFREHDAGMLLIGTTVADSFTFVHHVEEMEKVRYRRMRRIEIRYRDESGNQEDREFLIYAKRRGWTMEMDGMEELLRRGGFLNERSFNNVVFTQLSLSVAYDIIRKDIRENHARSIARFSAGLFVRDTLRDTLAALHLYRTPSDRIAHAPRTR